jgi:hypothetical protein
MSKQLSSILKPWLIAIPLGAIVFLIALFCSDSPPTSPVANPSDSTASTTPELVNPPAPSTSSNDLTIYAPANHETLTALPASLQERINQAKDWLNNKAPELRIKALTLLVSGGQISPEAFDLINAHLKIERDPKVLQMGLLMLQQNTFPVDKSEILSITLALLTRNSDADVRQASFQIFHSQPSIRTDETTLQAGLADAYSIVKQAALSVMTSRNVTTDSYKPQLMQIAENHNESKITVALAIQVLQKTDLNGAEQARLVPIISELERRDNLQDSF